MNSIKNKILCCCVHRIFESPEGINFFLFLCLRFWYTGAMTDKIRNVAAGSIAEECGIKAGDRLVSVNGLPVTDYIDYIYSMADQDILVSIQKADGGEIELEIEKEPYEELGITFESDGFGKKIACRNKCVFCFVDQLPKGMRKPLYFKDDDWRLSFLMGSYITLTNLSEPEIERIIRQRISPLYVSVHATNDDVRTLLMGTELAKDTYNTVKRLAANGIKMHTQIVVCEGINDGEVLQSSIEDLWALYPHVLSVAVIPVGLTGHRERCYPLEPVSKGNARAVVRLIQEKQKEYLKQAGTRFVFGADELYIKAGLPLPEEEAYEDYPQLENGVGLVAKFRTEVRGALADVRPDDAKSGMRFGVVTGADFYPFMLEIAKEIKEALGLEISVYQVKNNYFGESITVTGLLTGGDIMGQLKGKVDVDELLLGNVCFREQGDVLLDGVALEELGVALGVECVMVYTDGYDFVEQLLK